jgi:hypothetical protein
MFFNGLRGFPASFVICTNSYGSTMEAR